MKDATGEELGNLRKYLIESIGRMQKRIDAKVAALADVEVALARK